MKHFRNWEGAPALSGVPTLRKPNYVRDAYQTFDQATMDSAGAFLVSELERLDPTIHEPLIATTWTRDIDLRTDVQLGDETASYTVSSFSASGGVAPAGIAWASNEVTSAPRVSVDIGKISNPLNLWAMEVAYTIPELSAAQRTGRPIDIQMIAALNKKHQMDADQLVYVGDSTLSRTGLMNSALVTNVADVANNAAGSSKLWAAKTPDEILTDINELLVSVWKASGYVAPPTKLALSPTTFGYISTQKVSSAGNETILSYLKERNILTAERGIPLEIVSVKWLDSAARGLAAGNDRMVAYSQRADYVRFPMVPLIPAVTQFRGIWVVVPYFGRFGVVEVVYPETVGYRDKIA